MATPVSAFTLAARDEFMKGMLAIGERPMPAAYDAFTTKMASKTRLDVHTYMSALPRLRKFKGHVPFARLTNTPYTTENEEFRAGVTVNKTDLDDDQTGGYLLTVNGMPAQCQKDIGFRTLDKLAAGATDLCFDGTAFFADSHTIGSGDNLMTVDNAGNDGVTHYIIALVTTNPSIKPLVLTEREPISSLQTDSDTPQAEKLKSYDYWCDGRYGFSYGFWWDGVKMTITDTPSLTELQAIIMSIVGRFRTFTLPKGADVDTAMSVHENWVPSSSDLILLCNPALAELLDVIASNELIAAGTSGATITNHYKGRFTVIPTSALGA